MVGVNVGLQHVRVSGLEGTGGAGHTVSVAVHHVTIKRGSGIKQHPTNFASKLLLAVISSEVTPEVFLMMC